MASLFGHVAASTLLGAALFPEQNRWGFFLLAGFCAFAPDFDVLTFRFGIPYESPWGHRGFTHSLVFAIGFGWLMAWLFYRKEQGFRHIALWCMLATASHPLLDMLTTGGLGCALWWPFSDARHFFPWRPILVSPLEVSDFIGRWGLRVLWSEFRWIVAPGVGLVMLAWFFHKSKGVKEV